MPKAKKDAFKGLTLDEQRFVFHFLRESVSSENENEQIRWAERKSRIAQGMGEKFLKREHVQQEIQRRRAQVELEQARLIARDQAKLAAEEDKRKTVTLDKLEAALDGVVNLNPEKHGSTVLAAIQLGLVYTGTIRNGKQARVTPAETTSENSSDGSDDIYKSVFSKMREENEPSPATYAQPIFPEESPAALMPDQPAPRPPVLRVNQPAAPAPPLAGNPKSKKNSLEIKIT
jgi:hypothetical protein